MRATKKGPKCAHRGASGAGKNADCGVFGAPRGVRCYKNGGQNVARVRRVARLRRAQSSRGLLLVQACLSVSLSPCLLVSLPCGDNRVGGGDFCERRRRVGVAAGARRNAISRLAGQFGEPKAPRRRGDYRERVAEVSAKRWREFDAGGSWVVSAARSRSAR